MVYKNNLNKEYKENRECWLLHEFCKALNKRNSRVECGEKGSSDGRLIIGNEEIPVQIVSAEGVRYQKADISRKTKEVVIYDVKAIKWIKDALKIKVDKKYSDEKELVILIEYNGLGSINREYLIKELKDKEITDFVRRFKGVYILSPSTNGKYIEKSQREPILVKI